MSEASETVTFLFTDIVGSTRLWERHPVAMRPALARCDASLRESIESRGGHVFKTVGDGFCSAFGVAADALAAAIDAQRRLAAASWAETGPLPVRTALHSGTVERRDGDYFGPPVNRVARLLKAAHGGQILVSQVTRALLRDGLPAGVSLRSLGEHRLRDLPQPEQIWQVVAPDLPDRFPPLVTSAAPPNNLPAEPTVLIGRSAEVAELAGLLRRAESRLVTLTGPAGVGKTRVALAAARTLLDTFADGVFFVPLASVIDPARVLSAIAQAVGIQAEAGQPLPELLRSALRDRRLLLVLDNLEHLLPAAPAIADLLGAAPGLVIVATSQMRARLRAEREFVVSPLPVDSAAVDLFVERARTVRADFALTPENAAAVSAICERLDGLPLAIELAAVRVKLFPPAVMLARLTSAVGAPLQFLTGGARDLPERHQALRNAIAWTYELLDTAEQALFRWLGLFVGGATIEAAEAISTALAAGNVSGLPRARPESDVLDGLASLVDKSLLRQLDPAAPTSGRRAEPAAPDEPRFAMLATIREFAVERLEASGEAPAARLAVADYFLALAETAETRLVGAEQGRWLARLETEADNLRAVLAATARAPSRPGGLPAAARVRRRLRLATALRRFWYYHGYFAEGRGWLEPALAELGPAPAGDAETATLRAKALLVTARLALPQDDRRAARGWLAESLELFRSVGDIRGETEALNGLGEVALGAGDRSAAEVLFAESLARCRQIGFDYGAAHALGQLGRAATGAGDYTRAAELLAESLERLRKIGDQRQTAWAARNLALIARAAGDDERAAALGLESLRLCLDLGDIWGASTSLATLGMVAVARGRYADAARWLAATQATHERGGLRLGPLYGSTYEQHLARLRRALGEADFAARWVEGGGLTIEEAAAEATSMLTGPPAGAAAGRGHPP